WAAAEAEHRAQAGAEQAGSAGAAERAANIGAAGRTANTGAGRAANAEAARTAPTGVAARATDAEAEEYAANAEAEGEEGAGAGARQSAPEHELPLLTSADELQRAVIQNDVQVVLLLAGRAAAHDELLAVVRGLGCELWEIDPRGPAAAPAPRDGARPLYVAGFRCRPLLTAPLSRRTSAGKRALDIAVSGALLLLAGPLLLTCALVLRATEGPGVIFRQERVGKDGRLFTVLKFRTHRPADSQESATRWSVADEHRISPFCRFLRSTSLDELPQLWNVLRGDMSLVGPRPERPFFVDRFSRRYPHYAQRHRVLTGVTGLAQIHGLRGDTSIEDRCRFDNAYIDSWSLWQDLCILLRTVGCLLRRTGS
ncbi:sugar transferase, partial [Streptomyces aurantiacus]